MAFSVRFWVGCALALSAGCAPTVDVLLTRAEDSSRTPDERADGAREILYRYRELRRTEIASWASPKQKAQARAKIAAMDTPRLRSVMMLLVQSQTGDHSAPLELLAVLGDPDGLRHARFLLASADKNERIRGRSALSAAALYKRRAAFDILLDHARDFAYPYRKEALKTLAAFDNHKQWPESWRGSEALEAFAQDPVLEIRGMGLMYAARTPTPKGIDMIVKALGDRDAEVRLLAVIAIGYITHGTKLPVERIAPHFGDSDKRVRAKLLNGVRLRQKFHDSIVDRLDDPDPLMRLEAFHALRHRQLDQDTILKLLNDSDTRLRRAAMRLIPHDVPTKVVKILADSLEAKTPSSDERHEIFVLLGRSKTPAALTPLRRSIMKLSRGFSGRAADAFVRLSESLRLSGRPLNEQQRHEIVEVLRGPLRERRRGAITALLKLKAVEVLPEILDAMKKSYRSGISQFLNLLSAFNDPRVPAFLDEIHSNPRNFKGDRIRAGEMLVEMGRRAPFLRRLRYERDAFHGDYGNYRGAMTSDFSVQSILIAQTGIDGAFDPDQPVGIEVSVNSHDLDSWPLGKLTFAAGYGRFTERHSDRRIDFYHARVGLGLPTGPTIMFTDLRGTSSYDTFGIGWFVRHGKVFHLWRKWGMDLHIDAAFWIGANSHHLNLTGALSGGASLNYVF